MNEGFKTVTPKEISEIAERARARIRVALALKKEGIEITETQPGAGKNGEDLFLLSKKTATEGTEFIGGKSFSEIVTLLSQLEQARSKKLDFDLTGADKPIEKVDFDPTQEPVLSRDSVPVKPLTPADFDSTQPFLDSSSAVDVRHIVSQEPIALTQEKIASIVASNVQDMESLSSKPFDRTREIEEDPDTDAPNNIRSAEELSKSPVEEQVIYRDIVLPQKSKLNEEKESRVSVRIDPEVLFDQNFGISSEQLESIPGYEKLSELQKHVVFKNLQEYADQGRMPYVGVVYEGMFSVLGNISEKIPARGSKGMEAYGTVLGQFITGMATHGPKVFEQEGEILPGFIDLDLQGRREHRGELVAAMKSLNQSAGILSRTPASWLDDGIGTHSKDESRVMKFFKGRFSGARKNYNIYTERQKSYENAKSELSMTMRGAGFSESEIVRSFIESDKKVFELQFVQTSPDAVEAVQNIEDKNVWKDVGKSMVKTSKTVGTALAYFGLGFLGRTALTGVLGIAAAPTVAATLAGTRSWNRAAAELRERDRGARMGMTDSSSEALNIIPAQQIVNIGGEEREVGAIYKLKVLIEEFNSLPSDVSDTDRNELLSRIRTRTQYVEDKLKLNRIQFGSLKERPLHIANLFETLGMAQLITQEYNTMPKSALEEKLSKVLFVREDVLQNKRRRLQTKKVAWNAFRAGAFAVAGSYVAGLFEGESKNNGSIERETQPVPEVSEETSRVIETEVGGERLGTYTVQKGDTLSKIMSERIPSIAVLGDTHAQENAMQNIFRSVAPEELKAIGIQSGNVDRINVGDTIDMDLLLQSVESQRSTIDAARESFGTEPKWNNYQAK